MPQTEFYCNSPECRGHHRSSKDILGNRILDKHSELMVIANDCYCVHCGNWICGFAAAFPQTKEEEDNG
jgi:hypothetical protein